jgi:hypothetical protein
MFGGYTEPFRIARELDPDLYPPRSPGRGFIMAKDTSKRKPAGNPKARKPKASKAKATKSTGAGAGGSLATGILIINMIPKSLSRETNQDSEPSLSVNPDNPQQIVGTAFTPDPMSGSLAPVYVSTDGGNSWQLNSIVPSSSPNSSTHDISLAFAASGGRLYGGILRDPTINYETLRTIDFTAPTAMDVLDSIPNSDQPFSHATTTGGKDRVYIGNNDFNNSPNTATVDVWLDAAVTSPPKPKKVRIEARATAGQNGPQVRPVSHPDGTAYAAFYGWRTQTGSFPGNTLIVTTDIVVVRDDLGGSGANQFKDLTDPTDGQAGRLVARGVKTPFRRNGSAATGQQRIGGTLSLAIDPRSGQSRRVFLAWGDKSQQSDFVLHVRMSTDRGATWSANDLLTVSNATNAALAVNAGGVVGLLYQQLLGTGASSRWRTQLRLSADGVNWDTLVLADTPALSPVASFDPYIGDYAHLVAVGNDFFGIFSANNTPDLANFPNGVKYQRNVNFTSRTLLALDNTTTVAPSIDPYFFRVPGNQ